MNFIIDENYLVDVIDREEWGMYDNVPENELTHEQLIKILTGKDRCSSTGSRDHPEFAKLRDLLEEQGYIKTERGWWNGDRVTQPFTLNGKDFKIDERFPSACAMKGHLKFKR